jgi:hypothetical protein
MTIIVVMTLVGLFGLAMHLEYYWAAGGLVALVVLLLAAARRKARMQL